MAKSQAVLRHTFLGSLATVAHELLGEAHRRLLDDLTTRLTAIRRDDLTVQLLGVRERVLGPNHPDTLFTRNELANLSEQRQGD
jgi:hypothetical protein